MKYILALCLIFGGLPSVAKATSKLCLDALSSLFAEKIQPSVAAEFLKLQGSITMHRLAWTYLKAQNDDSDKKVQNIENTILELLNEKYTNNDPEFLKARAAFEAQPLSRAALADIAPYLKDVMAQKFKETDQNFVLNISDLKLLGALSKFEREGASENGIYDHRLLNSRSPQGILNFTKVINSSYKVSTTAEEENLKIDLKLNGLESVMNELQKRMASLLDKMKLPIECKGEGSCDVEENQLSNLFKQNDDVQKAIWESLASKMQNDDYLLNNLAYNDLWLKVRHKVKVISAEPVPKPDVVVANPLVRDVTFPEQIIVGKVEKPKPMETPVQSTLVRDVSFPSQIITGKVAKPKPIGKTIAPAPHGPYVSEIGLLIDDPMKIISREKGIENLAEIKNRDIDFQIRMAHTLIEDGKVFTYDNELYNANTGKSINLEEALGMLPPQRALELKKYLVSSDPDFTRYQVVAMTNSNSSFVYNDKLFSIEGKELNPLDIIATEMSLKLGVSALPSYFIGVDNGSLVIRANALKNSLPYYEFNHQVYDTLTGKNPSAPFSRAPASSIQDPKMEKKRRIIYEHLSDFELIQNFHRDRSQTLPCGYYAIVDKKNANMKIYSNDGIEVFSTEVLLGAKVSDQRTAFTKYGDVYNLTNQSTGAGVYSIIPKRSDSFNKAHFKDNILSLANEKSDKLVLAIHQVPVGLEARNARFGTGNIMDRRVSGGCVNLRESDLKKAAKWLGASCKVYILPEEEGNHFVLRNNQINFTSDNPIPANELKFYNFNSTKKFSPILISIRSPEGDTPEAQVFVETLSKEKEKLMRALDIDSDNYNDLATLAYGIMGNESDFGKSTRYKIKEKFPGLVDIAKGLSGNHSKNSHGFTQIKTIPAGDWQKSYPDVHENKLGEPRVSAIATMAYLADAWRVLKNISASNKADPSKVQITREKMVDYLAYIYTGRKGNLISTTNPATPDQNKYIQKLRKNISYIEISQKIE